MVTMRFSQGFSSVDRITTPAYTDLWSLIPILTLYLEIRYDLSRDQWGMRGGQGVGKVDVGRLVRLDVIRTMARIPSKNSLITLMATVRSTGSALSQKSGSSSGVAGVTRPFQMRRLSPHAVVG